MSIFKIANPKFRCLKIFETNFFRFFYSPSLKINIIWFRRSSLDVNSLVESAVDTADVFERIVFRRDSLIFLSNFFNKSFFKLLNDAVIPGNMMDEPSVVMRQQSAFNLFNLMLSYAIISVGLSHSMKMLASLISWNFNILAWMGPHWSWTNW